MKKLLSLLLVLMMTLAFTTACGSSDPAPADTEETTAADEMANPIHDCEKEDLVTNTNVDLEAPNGADTIKYFWIDNAPDSNIAQSEFTFNGVTYVFRGQCTQVTDIKTKTDGTVADEASLPDTLKDGSNVVGAFSGMYQDWQQCGETTVNDRPAVYGFDEKGQGYIAWLDVVPGVMYSMSMDKDCSLDKLKEMAEDCFVPMQGEA